MKRFYREVLVEQVEDGWRVLLDARPVKTQIGEAQLAPTSALADALAAEWREQGQEIDAGKFIFRDLTDYALDSIRPNRAATIAKLLAFAETDTLCYRADPGDALHSRQQEVWEPLVSSLETSEDIRFARVSGIIHHPQSADTLAKLRIRLEAMDDFTLAALQLLASLSASLCIGLAALEDRADSVALWSAANLEQEWQANLWVRDAEAEARLKMRGDEFGNAAKFASLVKA